MEALGAERQAGWRVPSAIADHAGALALAAGLWLGALIYFASPWELPWGFLVGWLGISGGLAAGLRPQWRWVAVVVIAAGLGIALGWSEVRRVEQTFDWRQLSRAVWVTGVAQGEAKPTKENDERVWVTLAPAEVLFEGRAHRVAQVAVTVTKGRLDKLRAERPPSDNGLALEALLWAPEGPRQPLNWGNGYGGGRDYRLWRFMAPEDGLRGYVRGEMRATYVAVEQLGRWARFAGWLNGVRTRMGDGTAGYGQGVVPALLVGDWRYVTRETSDDYRRAGLMHLLAISGYQLTVVGGGLFLLLRWGLAWWPWLALRVDIKRAAAAVALAATGFYALLSGAEVSVLRSLVMLAVLFGAILVGRSRSLVRAYVLAVIGLVAVNPACVMGAGFQLSFAAVGALILFGMSQGLVDAWTADWWHKLKLLLATGLVATLATEPIIALDFGQFSVVGLVANLGAEPAMAFLTWVGMGVLGLWPLGAWAWRPVAVVLGWGVTAVNGWAHFWGGWPVAQLLVPWWGGLVLMALSWAALAAIYAGRKVWAAGCLVGVAVAIGGLSFCVPVYSRVVDGEGREVGTEAPEGAGVPILPEGTAWAGLKKDGTWEVRKADCGREWQRFDKACQGDDRD